MPDGAIRKVHFPDANPDEVINDESLEELNALFGEVLKELMHELL